MRDSYSLALAGIASKMLELTESSLHPVGKIMSYLVLPQILERTITGSEVFNLEWPFLVSPRTVASRRPDNFMRSRRDWDIRFNNAGHGL